MQHILIRMVSVFVHKISCWKNKTPERFQIFHFITQVQFESLLKLPQFAPHCTARRLAQEPCSGPALTSSSPPALSCSLAGGHSGRKEGHSKLAMPYLQHHATKRVGLLPNKLLVQVWHNAQLHDFFQKRKRQLSEAARPCSRSRQRSYRGQNQIGVVNVNVERCREPAWRTVTTLNCSGTLQELKWPNSNHVCCVSAEPLTKPTQPHHCSCKVERTPPHYLQGEKYSIPVR